MKNFKKVFSFLLAVVLTVAMTVTVFADPASEYTISAPSGSTHTYEVYQIFTGDLSDGVLSNIKWGKNGTGAEGTAVDKDVIDALTAVNAKTDTEKLDVIEQYATLTAENKFGTVTAGASLTAPAGYYLIKDQDNSVTGDDAYTLYIVKVVGDVEISPKSAKPTVDKQVQDEVADAETGAVDGWGETADHAINESFKFKLKATLSADENYNAYETYKLVFTDTMSDGVTFEKIDSVTVDGITLDLDTDANAYKCTADAAQAGGNWTLTIDNIKAITGVNLTDGADVEVIYSAHLNEKATVTKASGSTDNANKVKLQYSNNPNTDGSGSLGETVEDTVWVFTYGVDNTKVDGSNSDAPLAGAGFKLYDADGTNEIGLIFDETLGVYRPVKAGETAVEMQSAETTGIFNIIGLDAGTYTLKETTTPAGYNTCAPITVTIEAAHSETQDTTSNQVDLSGSTGMNNTIKNLRGSTLPSTGGIGTTVFYIVGGIFVVAAGVLLIARKRAQVR